MTTNECNKQQVSGVQNVFLAKKTSGNYIITCYKPNNCWITVKTSKTPNELYSYIKSHLCAHDIIILNEYSRSQNKTSVQMFNKFNALKAFNLPKTKQNEYLYFIK